MTDICAICERSPAASRVVLVKHGPSWVCRPCLRAKGER